MSVPIPLLLVDDNLSTLLTLSALLEVEGFTVSTARSGAEARTILESGDPIRAAIVDRHLDAEDGIAVAAAIRAAVPSAAVFIHSGDPPEEELMDGLDGWLTKGTGIDDIIGQVRASVKARSD